MNKATKQLTVVEQSVALVGTEHDLETVTDRLMMLHPAAGEVGVDGMRLVGQLAILTGANPLPAAGEIWVWPEGRGQYRRIVVDLGIAYYRRKARQKDDVFWIEEPRPMTDAERRRYTVPDDSLGAICRGYTGSDMRRLLEMGANWKTAEERAARTSIGVVDHFEMFRERDGQYWKAGDPISPPKGRTWMWVCLKRAEKGWYRTFALIDTSFVDRLQEVQRMVAELEGAPVASLADPAAAAAIGAALQDEYGTEQTAGVTVIDAEPTVVETKATVVEPDDNGTKPAQRPQTPLRTETAEKPATAAKKSREAAPVPPTPNNDDDDTLSRGELLELAARAATLKKMAPLIVWADVGYKNVPHVVGACTSPTAGYNVAHRIDGAFDFSQVDTQDLVNWLVERKQTES